MTPCWADSPALHIHQWVIMCYQPHLSTPRTAWLSFLFFVNVLSPKSAEYVYIYINIYQNLICQPTSVYFPDVFSYETPPEPWKDNLVVLGYIEGYTPQLYRDYNNKPL